MADLDRLFQPRSVAVVGISSGSGKLGGRGWVKTLLELGFEGKIYPISSTVSECEGLRVYPSIEAVPDSIDHVVVSIPARFTPQLMEQCARKGVRFVQFFTAGFREVGDEGEALEKEIVKIANKGGTRIVGPNCMGVYCPGGRFSWRTDFPQESGGVALLSQSGWNVSEIVTLGEAREVRFSKVISYGNAADLNETDFLEYFTADQESKVITAYIEGVKDGRRFVQALRKATQAKPVVVLKGGRSQSGARATASHTAALAGMDEVWKSMLRQAGAIRVHNFDELLDVALAFLYLSKIERGSVALIGVGGGPGVIGADECEEVGLTLPPLPAEAMEAIRQFTPQEGTSQRNPIDSPFRQSYQQFRETIAIVASCREIASLIIHLPVVSIVRLLGEGQLTSATEAIIAAARDCVKPMTVVMRTSASPEAVKAMLKEQQALMAAGIPVYPTVRRAARAISSVLQYRLS